MRTGLIAEKIGMSRVYDEDGNFIPVTVLEVKDCTVVGQKTQEKDKYTAVQLGYNKAKAKHMAKPQLEACKKLGTEPFRTVKEFRVAEENMIDMGTQLNVDHFNEGQFIDVSGISIGKGFAGVIKRHNFRSLRASHGVSLTHRSHGSTGGCQDPGRVFKGKKMAGHLGNANVTVQNLKVVSLDKEKNLLIVKGAVPGSKGSLVTIKDSVKK